MRNNKNIRRSCYRRSFRVGRRSFYPNCNNNVHFKDKKSFEAQDVLLCIAQNTYLDQEAERERLTQEHYFKSSKEMRIYFMTCQKHDNTLEIV